MSFKQMVSAGRALVKLLAYVSVISLEACAAFKHARGAARAGSVTLRLLRRWHSLYVNRNLVVSFTRVR